MLAIPPGERKLKVSDIAPELKKKWEKWDDDKRVEESAEAVQELVEYREMKKLSTQNVPLAAFHDTCSNLRTIEREV